MALKTDLSSLLGKKMDRKDFLKHVAVGFVAVTGISSVIRALAPAPSSRSAQQLQAQGYGSSAYGGKKPS